MNQSLEMTKMKRYFCGIIGSLCLLMSLMVMSRILGDLWMNPAAAYGRVGMTSPHSALQIFHVTAALAFWSWLFLLGTKWIKTAVSRVPTK